MDDERRKKTILITISVAFLAIIIFLFWFFNLKNVMEANRLRDQGNSDSAKWQELKQEISSSLNDVNQQLNDQEQQNQLKENVNDILNGVMEDVGQNASSSSATSSESASTSTIIATSSPTDLEMSSTSSTAVKSDCPPYIDCMPSIGETKSCQVPAGCEGITQIAY